MGGFFYDGTDYSVYPDESGKKMILHSANVEATLCDDLASDINVKDGVVYYRKLNSRMISAFNISTVTTTKLPVNNVGQFIICEETLYYIDLSSSALIYACNVETHTSRKISEGTFVGGTDEMVLIFDSSEGIYQLVALD